MRSVMLLGTLMLLPLLASAAEQHPPVAMLPLLETAEHSVDSATRADIEEMLRSVASKALPAQGYVAASHRDVLKALKDGGADTSKPCTKLCIAVAMKRRLPAMYVVYGSAVKTRGGLSLNLVLYDIDQFDQLSTLQLEGKNAAALRSQFEKQSAAFFSKLPKPPPIDEELGAGGLGSLGSGSIGTSLDAALGISGEAEKKDPPPKAKSPPSP